MNISSDKRVKIAETPQSKVWKGDFGREYTDRNTFDIDGLEKLCLKNYGVSRSQINTSLLHGVSKEASFLEIGCNAGNQLLLLKQMGWSNLSGLELQPYALEIARSRLPDATLKQGSVLEIPWPDSAVDVVFTSVVLIHIAPQDLPRAMDEIHRTSRRYIWGLEYYAPQVTEIAYRNHNSLLWKMDYARLFLERFDDLKLVKEERLKYLTDENVDTAFLLEKKS